MTPDRLSKRVVSDRLSWIERMIGEIRVLPLDDWEEFFADRRNVGAIERGAWSEYTITLYATRPTLHASWRRTDNG